jgi:uncharacterized protein with von Willebrand factor type A (vWA) domain
MPDSRTVVRILDELLWMLRREGFAISPAQAMDCVRAVAAVGLERRADVEEAVAAVVVQNRHDRARFGALFGVFFDADRARQRALSLWERLAQRGFTEAELQSLRELLGELSTTTGDSRLVDTFLTRGAMLDFSLARSDVGLGIDAHSGPQLGFLAHRVLSRIGSSAAQGALAALRVRLRDELGMRGTALADALAQELEHKYQEVRAHVRDRYETAVDRLAQARLHRRLLLVPFASLADAELEEVRQAVRRFAEGLRGGARVRARRRAHRGRIDPHRTLRLAAHTSGVPFRLDRKQSRRHRPKLMLLCDVSDSVRAAAGFFLEFTYSIQELFERTRSFAFVSELGETTQLFAREPVRLAIALAWGGGVVRAGDNSNYGRVLRAFEEQYARDIDRRTTVIILGDGRTNFHDPAAEVVERLRERSRSVLWLCPEPRGSWAQGDSAMSLYAAKCSAVYEVGCASDLERAAHALVARS